MEDGSPSVQRAYPRTVVLQDGTQIGLRLMTPADAHRILAFAKSLPEDDLLFLRVDITKAFVVMLWGQNIKAGLTVTVLAEKENEVVGYAALHHNEVSRQRHLGELRLQVGPGYRSKGLFLEYESRRVGVRILLDLAPRPLWVDADLVQIEQVLLNLVRNALDALEEVEPGQRALEIQSRRTGETALVRVSDRGPGIPPERMGHLFDPFFTTKDSGMGMGLPISLTIVQDHGGRIWATSEPGAGADFHLELPCAEVPGQLEQVARGMP